ncbi:MAG: hypothetical protein COB24_00250 [Hyphomicrobiales bacterium]|nr:MAG: hypothetical protein COB24_00250 [Hyphomicrobiales bacterium]
MPLGTAYATWNKADLMAWPDEISACVYELPMRVLGGVEDTELENNCKREWYVGDALLKLPDDEFLKVMDHFYQ